MREGFGSEGLALDLWLDFLGGHPATAEAEFERLCTAHAHVADELRRLRSGARALADGAAARAEFETSLAERLRRLAEPSRRGARFERKEELGRGGMGVIHRVRDVELDRDLALKSLKLASGGRRALEAARFFEEAQVTAQLDHPGIVPVHEVGLDAESNVYFAMKLVQGRDLSAILALARDGREGWTLTRMLGVLLKVCEAMAYAHAKGVIHRDLKPGNVRVGHFGEVYVMDWGVARAVGRKDMHDLRFQSDEVGDSVRTVRREEREETPDSPLITLDGVVLGTPAYMPPEQARGEIQLLSARSDVYSLGAMLYHLLTGHPPYVEPGKKSSARAVLWRVIEGPPRPIQEFAPEAPPALVAICDKAMAREPARRYPGMGALADDLAAFLERRVVSAYRTGALAELRMWVRRNRTPAMAAGAVAGIAVVVAALWLQTSAVHASELADRNAVLATERRDAERRVALLEGSQRLEELRHEADLLWPPRPELVDVYEAWLVRARALLAALEPSADGRLPGYRAELAAIRARATEPSEEERERERRTHPRFPELAALRARLAELRRIRELARQPAELPALDAATLDPAAVPSEREALYPDALNHDALNDAITSRVGPERTRHGEEPLGLVLAELGMDRAPDGPERVHARARLAWALFANGRDEEALAEMERARADLPEEERASLAADETRLRIEVAERRRSLEPKALERLEEECTALEQELVAPRARTFASEEDGWWDGQLTLLIQELEHLADPSVGLIDGISADGWGIARRKAFAETIAARSLTGPEAARLWSEACRSIADEGACSAYHGLVLAPQIGLLPLGQDAHSGLWEFADLLTGAPAPRAADGTLSLDEDSGLVFVLIPGGGFPMGAQSVYPAAENFDREAELLEGPVHEVWLSPYFLSKYEMTQAQWQRWTGRNPSYYSPDKYLPSLEAKRAPGDRTHPVEQVSWRDCELALEHAGLSLPSEAQWEFGARGGTSTPWWTGSRAATLKDKDNVLDGFAWRNGGNRWGPADLELNDGYTSHARVGSFPANPFGLHEVIGNVAEWCRDGFDGAFYRLGSRIDPCASPSRSSSRVHRGGSFGYPVIQSRLSARLSDPPDKAELFIGLRPARALAR